jgi:alpha-tubulin suppressor-like RCC1 family protein
MVPVSVKDAGGIGTLGGVVEVASGFGFTCARTTDQRIWCWGTNNNGRLGNHAASASPTPVSVVSPDGTGFLGSVRSVAAGTGYACAVTTSGALYCWGDDAFGQLGDNTTSPPAPAQTYPVQVLAAYGTQGSLLDVAQVAAGDGHTCARQNGNEIWCWGQGGSGELGNNTEVSTATPRLVMLCP